MSVYCETYSLTFVYMGFSKPLGLPGFHEFTVMSFLDNVMIDYYNCTKQKKVPKQPWMKENFDWDYWAKGTLSRFRKQQWFKTNIRILMERHRQNDTDTHVLQ